MDDFKIENGELISYSGNKDNITIPEGVISISGNFNCETSTKTVVLPKTLKHIGNGAFHRYVAFTGDYHGVILILFGVKIDLTRIYYDNYEDFDEYADCQKYIKGKRNKAHAEEVYYEEHRNDNAWEHYNSWEDSIRCNIIDEINAILEKNNDYKFKYIPSETVEEIVKNMNN